MDKQERIRKLTLDLHSYQESLDRAESEERRWRSIRESCEAMIEETYRTIEWLEN